MASIDLTRPNRRPAHTGRLSLFSAKPPMRWAAALGVLACALAAGLLAHGGGESASSSDTFLTQALGEKRPGAPLMRRPAPGVQVRLDSSGFRVSRKQMRVGISLAGNERGKWERFADGVSRPTAYGRESIVVDSTGTEQFLTVERLQGKRDWQWLLDTDARPRLQPDGSILYGAGLVRTPPVAILDAGGRDVTPEGSRWSLREQDGTWRLGLRLDDSKLSLPYVIDPAADYPSPLYLSNQASTETGSWKLITAAPSASDVTTNNTPLLLGTGHYLWIPGQPNATAAAPTTTPAGTGWVLDTAGGTGFPTGNWVFTVTTDIPNTTLVAGAAILNVGIWKGTISGGVFTPTGVVLSPVSGDDPASQDLRSATTPVTTNVTISVPRFSLAAGERLFVEYRRNQVVGINSAVANRRQLNFEVNAGANNQIAHPTADDIAPANALSITSATGAHFNSGTLYYKSDAAGSFSFSNALTDGGSGPYGTTYPAIGTTGWTHALETVTTGPPHVSSTYSWTTNPTNPANQTLVGEDAAMQQANSVVSFASDTSAPTGMSASVTGGYFTSTSVPVALVNGSDTGSGINAGSGIVERDEALLDNGDGSCDAFPGSWSTVTLSGGDDTSVVSGKCYRYRYKISDNVGNQGSQAGTSATAKVDTSAPSDPTLSYGSFTNAADNGGVVWYRPSAASGQFEVTASGSSDTQSGVASHSFPAAASGWSLSGSGNARTYSHSGSPTDPSEPNNVFSTNGAGLNSNSAAFTVSPDSTGPSVTAPSVTAGFYTSTSVGVSLNGGSDSESGLAAGSSIVERDEAPLDNGDGSCDAFPGSWATVTLSGGNDTTVVSGKCYRYRELLSDRVGNQGSSSASNTAKIDTSAPSDPSPSYGSFTNAAVNGGVVWYRPSAASGQYQVTASSTDPQSGVPSYSFPAAASGWSLSGSGNARTYSHSGSPTDPSEPNNVFSTNGAGLTSNSAAFTVSPDSTAPSVTAPTVTAGYYTSLSIPVSLNGGSDSESGVNAGSSVVERDEAPLDNGDGSCDAFPGAWATVTLSGGNDTTVVSGKCYRYRELLSDRVGNQSTSGASNTAKVDSSAPGDPSLSYGSFTNAAVNGGVVWYRPSAASGQYQVTASSTDPQSGVPSYSFPAAASGWSISGSGAARTYSHSGSPTNPAEPNDVRATNGAGLNSNDVSFTVTPDSTAPSVSAPGVTAGYFTSLSVAVAVNGGSDSESGLAAGSSVVERDEASLDNGDGSCDVFPGTWSTVTLSGGNDTTVQSGKCYRYRELLSDNVGNQGASSASATAKVDTNAPTDPSLSYGSFTNAADNGGIVWYRPSAASGQFQVTASSTDAQSGVASYSFPAAASGWSVSGSGAARTYSHSGSPTNPAEPNDVRATNGAGLNSNNVSFTVSPDSTAPSVTAPTVTAGYYTSLSIPVSLNSGSDSESGVNAGSSVVERDETPLDNGDGSCDAFPGSWSTITLSGGNDTTVVSGKCYRYRELLSDNVGNQGSSAASSAAKVDSSAPGAPSLSYGSLSNAAVTGDTVYYRSSAANGQFQVTAAASDAQSGIASYGFPATASGWSVSGSGSARTYSHTGSPTDPAEPNDVSVTNGAGLASAVSGFTVTPDASAPSGISASVTGGYYTALSVAVTLDNGSDTGSGIDAASGIVERDETPLDNGDGSCDAFPGSWSTITLSGGNDTTVLSGQCYRYRYTLSDRVGNQATSGASASVKVDTSAPAAPSLSYGSLSNAILNLGVVYYTPSAASGQFAVTANSADGQSGIASYGFAAAASGWSVSGSGDTRTYSHLGSPSDPAEPNDVSATNGAGLTSSATSFTVTPDGTPPTTSIQCDGGSCGGGWYTADVSVSLSAVDGGSGLNEIRYTTDGSDPSPINGTVYSSAFTISSATTIRFRAYDRLGNEEVVGQQVIQIDPSAPSTSAAAANAAGSVHWNGSGTVFYRPGGSGSFDLTATVTDAQSGPQKANFPNVSGFGVGGDDTSVPFSKPYSYTGSPAEPGSQTITGYNNANASSTASVAITADPSAPSGISATVAGGYYTSASVAVTLDNGSDTGSGIDATSAIVERDEAPLDNGDSSCDAFPGSWSTVTLSGGNDTSVVSGKCYRYRYLLSDRVGNQATSGASATGKVDTSAPAAPGLSYGSLSNVAVTGDTVYYRSSAANGQFQVSASSSDVQSGIASHSFPAAGSGWSLSGSGNARTYSHSGSPTDPAEPNDVSVTNGAGLASAVSGFTVTPDASAPSGISASVTGGYYTAVAVAVTLDNGSDTGSGVDPASAIVERDEAPLDNGDGSCDSFAGSWSSVTLSGGNDTTVQSGKCYRYRYLLSDRVGNQATSGASATAKVDTSAPAAPSLSYGSLSNAIVNLGVVYYVPGAASGQFAVTAASSDGQSGVGSYGFPAPSTGWSVSGSGDTRTYSHSGSPSDPAEPNDVTANNGAGLTSSGTSFTVTPDGTPPTTSIQCDGGSCAGGWYTADVSVSLSSVDGGSGLDEIRYTTDGSDPSPVNGTVYASAFTISSATTIRFRAYDRLGNEEVVGQQVIQIDPSEPATSAAAANLSGSVHWNGSGTVFYRPGGSGAFDLTASVTDAQSGPQKANFPNVSGFGAGGDDTTVPFSKPYSYTGSPVEPGSQTVTGFNNANASSTASVGITADSSAPSGISALVTGGYYTSVSVAVTLDNGSDTGSGIDAASAIVERDEAPLDNGDGSCDSFPGSWSSVTLSGGNDTTVQSGKCYRYRYLLSDRVGNQSTSGASATAKVDTSAPAAPSLNYGSLSNTATTGDTVYYRSSAASGQFQVTANSSDVQSGVASYSFPAAASGWSVSGSGSARTYSHSGSPTDPAEPNDVSVTNGAGLGSPAASFTVTPDGSAPSGISASVTGGYYTALSIAVTLDNGSDTGSGIDAASAILERDEAPLDNGDGSCDAFPGSWSTVTLSGGNDTSVVSGTCYRYRYLLSDRVGNQATSGASATAKVDTSGPATPTLSFGSLQAAFAAGSTVYYRPSAANGQFALTATSTDGQSGITSYGFPATASGWSVSGSGDTRTYSHSGSPTDPAEPLDVTAQNGAGLVSGAAGYTVTPDASAPTSSILCDGASCPAWNPAAVSVTLSSSDTGSGLNEIRYTTDGSDPTPSTGTVYSGAFSVSVTTEIRYRGFDRVGNAEAVQSETIEFDTTAPAAPALTLAESPADPDQHVSGSTIYYRPGGGRSGSFTVDAATSDAQSGIQKVAFPAVGGMTGGGDDFASPYLSSYDWTTGTGSSGAQTVTARDNAGLTSTGSFTVTPDPTAPTGQTIGLVGGPYYTTLSVPVSLGNGIDGDSGVDGASGVVERDEAALDNGNGTCDAFPGAWSTVTLTAGNDTTVQNGKCYRYRYTISDRVGNQSSPSAQSADAKVDATTPVTSDDAPAGWGNAAVTVNLSVTETGSGVASTQYRIDGGSFQNGASVSIPAPADHSNDGAHAVEYRSTDNAGNTEILRSATVRIDTTLPLTTDDAPAGWSNSAVTVTLTANDALSGIASTEYRVDGGSFQNGASVSIPAPADHSNDGAHTIEYRSADNAGNNEPLRTATVRIDTTLPNGSVSTPTEGLRVNGVVPVTAAANDVPSGVTSVEFFVRPSGAPVFTSISTDTTAPYQATWDSSSAAEGNAELKVVVVDAASNSLTSAVRNVIVDNPPNVSLDDPGANVAGPINLTASSAPDTAQVVFERSLEGAGSWTSIATDLTAPYAASFDTSSVADERYDFRAVATDAGGFGGTSQLRTARVDNTVPSVSISDPPNGAVVGGPNVHLGSLASDLGSGVASVKFEGRPAGGGAFNLIATDNVPPYDGFWNASALSGLHELRATATDSAGNPATSVSVLVTVDSTAPSVTLGDLGSLVRGVVTLAASTQGAAVTQVVFKRRPSGGASWTALETDTAGPWNAAFDTNAVADGTYDLRAEALDSIGAVLAGHTRENVRVDNTAPVVQSASPADGSSVSSATSIVLVANEAVAAVRGATLDGAVTTPEIAGTRVTFATGTLGVGDHTLVGSIEDAAGNASGFRVKFSVRAAASTSLALQIGKPTSAKRGRNQIFSVRVTLSVTARVRVTLLSPTGRRLRTTSKQLPAGRRVVSLSIPRASLPPGRYTMLVTATTPDGTQVLRRAQVVIKKATKQKKRKRAPDKRLQPREVAAPLGSASEPPPPATASDNTPDGLEPSPRETGETAGEKPRAGSKPLATATNFVGEKKRRTLGLALVIVTIGGAIGFLIKIELHRLLGWPKRLAR